jgi:hypothetical protein
MAGAYCSWSTWLAQQKLTFFAFACSGQTNSSSICSAFQTLHNFGRIATGIPTIFFISGMRLANLTPNMFTAVERLSFGRARKVGMGILAGFVTLGTGASLSSAADEAAITTAANLAPEWSLTPSVYTFSNSVTLPEPASPWFYSVAGGLCLLILVRRKAQL